jgi:hypothetical protein
VRGGQGQALGLDIRFGDPGNGPWTVVVNPGDGSPLEVVPTWSRSMAVAHRYDRAGAFPLTVAVWDAFGGVDMRVITALVVPTTQPTPSPVPIRLDRVEPVRDARGAVTHLVLAFTGALDAARASQVSAYSLRGPGRDGRLGTRDDTTVRIRAATYAPEARAVVLQLGSAVPGVSGLRFSIRSGLVLDPAGRMLDGDADGAPGGDAVRTL